MRKLWIMAAVLIVAAAYWVWPLYGAYSLARAAERQDAVAVAAQVDFKALRKQLARQVVRAYLRQSGRDDHLSALGRGLAVGIGSTVADPYLAEMLTPDAVTALLGEGRLKPITLDNRTLTFDGTMPSLTTALSGKMVALLGNSWFDGVTSFVLHPNGGDPPAQDFGIHLHLAGTTWQLSGVDLPAPVLDRIAADIIAKQKAANS